ncbi:hypothetical protein C8J57DRAFT_1227885 [Mycena rebaudengoi]|nr:hypothetical protein C8J57DRAFT_1227885 [Mycena rebaudengoi]
MKFIPTFVFTLGAANLTASIPTAATDAARETQLSFLAMVGGNIVLIPVNWTGAACVTIRFQETPGPFAVDGIRGCAQMYPKLVMIRQEHRNGTAIKIRVGQQKNLTVPVESLKACK